MTGATQGNTQGARKRPGMGEFYNPYRMFRTFTVVPLSLLPLKMSDGAKLLFGLLAYHAGEDGQCYPGVDRLANRMGVSEDTVRNRLNELEKAGLIARNRRGPGRSTAYRFKMQACLMESMSLATDPEDSRDQAESAPLIPKILGSDPEDSRVLDPEKPRGHYKEEENKFEEKKRRESSSSFGGDSVAEAGPEEPIESTTTNAAVSLSEPEPEPIPFDHARETLRRLRYSRDVGFEGLFQTIEKAPLPDATITRQIIGNGFFLDRADFDHWAATFDSKPHKFRNPGYGLPLADARKWPDERAAAPPVPLAPVAEEPPAETYLEQVRKRQAERAEHEAKCKAKGWQNQICDGGKFCEDCHGYGRILETGDYCQCANGRLAKADDERKAAREARCPHCGGDGYRNTGERPEGMPEDSTLTFMAFCECEHGDRIRAKEPDLVEKYNALMRREADSYRRRKERERIEQQGEQKRKASGRTDFVTPGQMLTSARSGGWEMRA